VRLEVDASVGREQRTSTLAGTLTFEIKITSSTLVWTFTFYANSFMSIRSSAGGLNKLKRKDRKQWEQQQKAERLWYHETQRRAVEYQLEEGRWIERRRTADEEAAFLLQRRKQKPRARVRPAVKGKIGYRLGFS
jgi:hypothetical protein